MSYTKQTWTKGDIVSADKLNHIEDGIESASSGGGSVTYDIIVKCDGANPETMTDEDLHLVEGDFESAVAKIEDEDYITAILYQSGEDEGAFYMDSDIAAIQYDRENSYIRISTDFNTVYLTADGLSIAPPTSDNNE